MINLKRTALIGMVLMLAFVITACSSSSDIVTFTGDRPVRGEVSGTVVETFSDETPIEGVRLTDGNSVTSSEADGTYVLYGVNNEAEISVSRDGYDSESMTIVVEEDGDVITQNFRLNKKYSEDNDELDDSDNEENNSEDETTLVEIDLLIELRWQKGAEDLDAHLLVPDPENSEQEGYHIYYDNQGSAIDDNGNFIEYPYAGLDQDILTYHDGLPERIKIEKLYEGRYIYFVKNFTMYVAEDGEEIPEISDSEAMVIVRENGERTEYKPENQTGMYWYLFEIKVDEDGYEIIGKNEITDEEPELN